MAEPSLQDKLNTALVRTKHLNEGEEPDISYPDYVSMVERGRLRRSEDDTVKPSQANLAKARHAVDLGRLYGYPEHDIAHFHAQRAGSPELGYLGYMRSRKDATFPEKKAAGGTVKKKRRLTSLGFYSHAGEQAEDLPQEKGTPEQFKAMLLKRGVKPDEVKHSGFDQAFAGKKSTTKHEIAEHFHQGVPKVKETMLGGRNIHDDGNSSDIQIEEMKDGTHAFFLSGEDQPIASGFRTFADADAAADKWLKKTKPTRYKDYTLPGGTNYREALLHLPEDKSREQRIFKLSDRLQQIQRMFDSLHRLPDSAAVAQRRAALSVENTRVYEDLRKAQEVGSPNHTTGHWETPNVLAHLRMSDRNGPKGEKILHLEELQSDWAQEGRKNGIQQPTRKLTPEEDTELADLFDKVPGMRNGEPEIARYNELRGIARGQIVNAHGVPAAPYIDSTQKWVGLGLQRLLHHAAKGKYDKIVVTPGEEQAKRYDLSKHVDKVNLVPSRNAAGQDHFRIDAFKDNKKVIEHYAKDEHEIASVVGKEVAEKLLKGRNQHGAATVAGEDLRIGGEGMKAFYDTIVPQTLEKLAKRHDPNAKVQLNAKALPAKKGVKVIPRAIGGFRTEGLGGGGPDGIQDAVFQTERDAREHIASLTPPVHSLDVTPQMRESILQGQPAFEFGGEVERAKLQKAAGGSVNRSPTEGQKAAGNYAKEHRNFQGLPLSIENKRGSVRSGVDASGKRWSARLPADYGYVRGTEGADGDHVDCFVGPDTDSPLVVVIDQHDHRGGRRFDEHKIVLGTRSEREAVKLYSAAFSDGHGADRIGGIKSMSIDALKHWLKNGKTKRPVKNARIVEQALGLART